LFPRRANHGWLWASVISHGARIGPTHRLPVQRDAGPGRESGHPQLEELTPTDDEELRALWQRAAEAAPKDFAGWHGAAVPVPAEFLVLVTWREEGQQVELLRRLEVEGMECTARLS
jgi:hypothetical protein